MNTVKSKTINYIDKSKKFKIKLLKQIEYFESYDLEDFSMFFDEVQYQMNLEEFEENIEIIQPYMICNKLYFIVDGQVEIELHS